MTGRYNSTTIVKKRREKRKQNKQKKWGKGLGCGGRGLSKGKVWAVGGAYAQDPQGWKRPCGIGGWGLGSRNRRGPGMSPTPRLRGQGTSPGSPGGFLDSNGWGKHPPLLSCSSGLGSGRAPQVPPICLSCSPLGLFLMLPGPMRPAGVGTLEGRELAWEFSRLPGPEWAEQSPSTPPLLLPEDPSRLPLPDLPPMPQGPTRPGGGFGGQGTRLRAQQGPRPEWPGRSPSAPLPHLLEGPSCLPLLISLASGALILSGLHFSFPLCPPTSYRFTWGFLLSAWASGSPTSGWQAP